MEENTTVIAVDIAKTFFEIAVSATPGRVSEHHRLKRASFLVFFKNVSPAIVVMEACGSAHYWGREIEALGHKIVLLPPHQVRPYVTRNKTDRTDAKGILEAFRNDDIHPVPVKTVDQQVLVAIHRFRSGWIGARTAQVNTLRGLLREIGFFIPEGIKHVVPQVRLLIEDADSKLPDALRSPLAVTCDQIDSLSQLIKKADRELESLADQSPAFERLATAPGVGLIVGTALLGFVGTPHRFPSGRHFASYFGITPRERSSGGKRHLGRISKRGDAYIRHLFIHGARSVLSHAGRAKSHDRLRAWALELAKRTSYNKAVVALANKIARIAWAVWRNDRPYLSVSAA
jgi:transposase